MCSPRKTRAFLRTTNAASMQKKLVLITDGKAPTVSSENETSKKTVRFGSVQIYHCAVELGTSPCVSSGPPICLGPLIRKSVTTVSAQEMQRSSQYWLAGAITPLAKRQLMILTSDDRVQMLIAAGYEQKEIVNATITAMETRMALIRAIQRRRAKKERSDSFRRLFSKLGLMEEVKEEPDQRKKVLEAVNPIVRAAKAC